MAIFAGPFHLPETRSSITIVALPPVDMPLTSVAGNGRAPAGIGNDLPNVGEEATRRDEAEERAATRHARRARHCPFAPIGAPVAVGLVLTSGRANEYR